MDLNGDIGYNKGKDDEEWDDDDYDDDEEWDDEDDEEWDDFDDNDDLEFYS
ncbi:MAG: hypothetical protein ACFE8J_18130 [Candidatus Heimdallarchaeota archaeon]